MKTSLFLLLSLFAFSSYAEALRIVDIFEPEKKGDEYLVLASDGLVYEVSPKNTTTLEDLKLAMENKYAVELETPTLSLSKLFNTRERISNVLKFSDATQAESFQETPGPSDNFEPTVLRNAEEAGIHFKRMRTDTRRRSQCFNRAYVWNYELYKNYNIKSRKIFIFFTRKYIREYRYKWWFHVAPLTQVNMSGKAQDVVLDREFSSSPQLPEVWKNDYMHNGAPCPEVKKYSDYSQNQDKEYCYFIKASMYYWQPLDLENLEERGEVINDWNQWKLDRAYRDAIR